MRKPRRRRTPLQQLLFLLRRATDLGEHPDEEPTFWALAARLDPHRRDPLWKRGADFTQSHAQRQFRQHVRALARWVQARPPRRDDHLDDAVPYITHLSSVLAFSDGSVEEYGSALTRASRRTKGSR